MHVKSFKRSMHICIFYFYIACKRWCKAVSQLSQQLSGNSMTEFWEKCVIMKITKNGRKKDLQLCK